MIPIVKMEHFGIYKRDGRECTIYPNCIEQGATNE